MKRKVAVSTLEGGLLPVGNSLPQAANWPASAIRDRIRQTIVAALPAIDRTLSPDLPLTTYGMDSIVATELSVRLSEEYDVRLSPTVAFDFPTLSALTARVVALIGADPDRVNG